MEQCKPDRDIRALCVKANSFPHGIPDAFDRLGKLLGPSGGWCGSILLNFKL